MPLARVLRAGIAVVVVFVAFIAVIGLHIRRQAGAQQLGVGRGQHQLSDVDRLLGQRLLPGLERGKDPHRASAGVGVC
ncbi:hypothetical protein D3C85_1535910 [compost metagenome]